LLVPSSPSAIALAHHQPAALPFFIGWENASEVLPARVQQLVNARGGEETSAWRHPMDFVPLLQQVAEELPALLEEGRRAATVTEDRKGTRLESSHGTRPVGGLQRE